MHEFSSCMLVKIFRRLDIRSLLRCSTVCKEWRDLIYDSCLWKTVDLTDYRWSLDCSSLASLIHTRFQPCLRSLNLSGFSLTPEILTLLAEDCINLQAMVLETATFVRFEKLDSASQPKFPKSLAYLDLRLSTGEADAFKLISLHLENIQYLGFTDELLLHGSDQSADNKVSLFKKLSTVKALDFNCCNSFYDTCLAFIGRFCNYLTSLTIEHCNNIRGVDLHLVIENCPLLRTLKFSGTSLHDDNLERCDWSKVKLEELEISWCRNVTEYGLFHLLPQLPHLIYLRLCSCGFGQAITDDVLSALESHIHTKLKYLDVSYSREITNNGTAELIDNLPTLRQFNIACCPKLNPDLLRKISTNKELLVVASFHEDNSYLHHNERYCSRTKRLLGGEMSVVQNSAANPDELEYFSFRRQFQKY